MQCNKDIPTFDLYIKQKRILKIIHLIKIWRSGKKMIISKFVISITEN